MGRKSVQETKASNSYPILVRHIHSHQYRSCSLHTPRPRVLPDRSNRTPTQTHLSFRSHTPIHTPIRNATHTAHPSPHLLVVVVKLRVVRLDQRISKDPKLDLSAAVDRARPEPLDQHRDRLLVHLKVTKVAWTGEKCCTHTPPVRTRTRVHAGRIDGELNVNLDESIR